MKLTKCLNCGAPLLGKTCAYCGAEYGEKAQSEPLGITLDKDSLRGALTFCGEEYDVYLVNIHEEMNIEDVYWELDDYGRKTLTPAPNPNIKFTLCGTRRKKEITR